MKKYYGIEKDGQVGITVDNKLMEDTNIYDLSGRRVQHTVKGSLYIKGGHKFMAQ